MARNGTKVWHRTTLAMLSTKLLTFWRESEGERERERERDVRGSVLGACMCVNTRSRLSAARSQLRGAPSTPKRAIWTACAGSFLSTGRRRYTSYAGTLTIWPAFVEGCTIYCTSAETAVFGGDAGCQFLVVFWAFNSGVATRIRSALSGKP